MNDADDSAFVFWEKRGCKGNRRQKWLLLQHDHRPAVKDLLTHAWTARELRPFFADKPVCEWFNKSAPAIKSGVIKPHLLDEDIALLLMVNDPILVCRPLMQLGNLKQSGFEPGLVLDALGISLNPEQDLQSCPVAEGSLGCEAPA